MVLVRRLAGARSALCLLMALAAAMTAARAQTPSTAVVRGRVLDETGTPIPGVNMKLSSVSAPAGAQSVVTDLEGSFRFMNLPPGGDYVLVASVPGYATVEAGPLDLRPGRESRLELTMKPSTELQETVKVEARGDTVDTGSTSVTTSFNEEFIEGIPLVGRSFSDLLTLAPGVTDPDGDGNVNVRGSRDTGLQLRVDGTNANDPLTGHTGQNINLETVEDLEVVTGGAPAEYGRGDGGFANVVTKSGGNELSGSLKLFYRSNFLDGSGATSEAAINFRDVNLYATVGGPVVKDRLWYFASLERLDEEKPIFFEDRTHALQSMEGWRNFGKLTWQASGNHKLTFQISQNPTELLGNYIGPTTAPETDYRLDSDATVPQFTWTAILSPALLLQVVFSYLDARTEINPVSDDFRIVQTDQVVDSSHALTVRFPCQSVNCDNDSLRRLTDEGEDGAYNVRSAVDLSRATMKTDFSYTLEDHLGQHGFKSGFLFESETYDERLVTNPVVTDNTCSYGEDPANCPLDVNPNLKGGDIFIQVFDPVQTPIFAESFNMGAYVQDSWRLRPNLTLNLGVRVDREYVTSFGATSFDPQTEAVDAQRRFEIVCEAAIEAGQVCVHTPARIDGVLTSPFTPLPDSPALQFDVDQDGAIDVNGAEREIILEDPYTFAQERTSESFAIDNTNLSPRLSVSWDPWNDGKTKVYGTYGRYYDRLFLGAVVTDQKPASWTATWNLDQTPSGQVLPDEMSRPLSSSISVPQTDRELATPYTDEFTAGFERELAPEWSIALTWISREGNDLLQDVDINHITCPQFKDVYGVDPYLICGDNGQLETDRFGSIVYGTNSSGQPDAAIRRNGATDLYTLNPHFNQVLRVGNFNASEYRAWELTLRKRLHRNWQMQGSYTWSRAEGDSESFTTVVGNDPAVSDKASGYLGYDQRHILKFQAVAHLAHEILVGTAITWASGLPYSLVANTEDYDDHALLTPQRVFSVTGQLNDQRNESQLTVDGRIEKRFNAGKTQITGFLAGENLLNRDELVLREVDRDERGIVNGERRFGRRFEIGASVLF